MKNIKDKEFVIYSEKYVSLTGKIADGCLSLESNAYGDDHDSEKHYEFSEEETEKLFKLISIDDFVKLCQKEHLLGMEKFLKDNSIEYRTFTY